MLLSILRQAVTVNQKNSMRLGIFLLVVLAGFLTPFWFFVLCAIAYALWKPAYELIFLGVIIDAHFGIGTQYFYTLVCSLLVLVLEMTKPLLSFYEA